MISSLTAISANLKTTYSCASACLISPRLLAHSLEMIAAAKELYQIDDGDFSF